jgi:hypothetical protein
MEKRYRVCYEGAKKALAEREVFREENALLRKALEKIAASGLDCYENECTNIACKTIAGETNG